MQPLDIQNHLRALKTTMGEGADVFCTVESRQGQALSLSGYPEGITKGCAFRVQADEWEQLLALATEKWREREEQFTARVIRDMALEIIRITSELGSCSDAALRGSKWTSGDVTRFGERACIKANEMANNGPFSILCAAESNAA